MALDNYTIEEVINAFDNQISYENINREIRSVIVEVDSNGILDDLTRLNSSVSNGIVITFTGHAVWPC